jgi:cytoplasmic iron level regulating protein YaaA (DUF328/UPF0246 family)
MKKWLLVISCSNRKSRVGGLLPAIERYTGAWYGVVNKLRREKKLPQNLDIVIISARYGFLRANELIEYYNLRMTEERAKELNPQIINGFKSLLNDKHYDTVFINLGKDYMAAVKGLENIAPQDTRLYYATGRVGERKSQMKKWILSLED